MNLRSIKFRLMAWYAGLLTTIFLMLCGSLYLDLRNFLETNTRESQDRRMRLLCDHLLAQAHAVGEASVIGQIKDWFAPESNDRFIRIRRPDGEVVYISGAPQDGLFNPAQIPLPPASSARESFRPVKLPNGASLLIASMRYQSPGNPDYLVEFGGLQSGETMLNHLFMQLAVGLPLAVGIMTAGGYLLVQRALRPVEVITRAAEKITQLNLSDRLPVASTGDEFEQLSLALNRMIGRLDDAFQNSKRFVADASHDLRTPLTILRGELEGMVEDPETAGDFRGRLAELLEQAIHLSKIVEQLFTLSKLDSGESQKEWTRFDLADLARTTADQMSLLAEDKSITLNCDARQAVFVHGDRYRIKQVIVNLLDNAVKYTRARGEVGIRVRRSGQHAVLEVEDTGQGIPPEALPHVFERFYRVDKARSGGAESAGLGLSIVKAICTAHGGQVEAASLLDAGSRFSVKLPMSAPDSGFLNS